MSQRMSPPPDPGAAAAAELSVTLPTDAQESLRVVARTADRWGAGWEADEDRRGGRLTLPVLAGARRGRMVGQLSIRPTGSGSRLSFRAVDSEYWLEKPTVLVLILAGCGALATVLAPFFPALIPLVPAGVVVTLAAWFFVVARLKNSGPEEFLDTVAEDGAAGAADPSSES